MAMLANQTRSARQTHAKATNALETKRLIICTIENMQVEYGLADIPSGKYHYLAACTK